MSNIRRRMAAKVKAFTLGPNPVERARRERQALEERAAAHWKRWLGDSASGHMKVMILADFASIEMRRPAGECGFFIRRPGTGMGVYCNRPRFHSDPHQLFTRVKA